MHCEHWKYENPGKYIIEHLKRYFLVYFSYRLRVQIQIQRSLNRLSPGNEKRIQIPWRLNHFGNCVQTLSCTPSMPAAHIAHPKHFPFKSSTLSISCVFICFQFMRNCFLSLFCACGCFLCKNCKIPIKIKNNGSDVTVQSPRATTKYERQCTRRVYHFLLLLFYYFPFVQTTSNGNINT